MRDSFNCNRDKKIATEKALIAASRKEVFEWPAYLTTTSKKSGKD